MALIEFKDLKNYKDFDELDNVIEESYTYSSGVLLHAVGLVPDKEYVLLVNWRQIL